MALDQVRESYDFVVLDLPPSLSPTVIAALSAADWILTPVSTTNLALAGLGSFLAWTEDLREVNAITAPLLGVLATMVDSRTKAAREVLEALKASGVPMFEGVIPRRVAAEEEVQSRGVTGDGSSESVIAVAYAAITVEVLDKIGKAN